jgi:hypothetical protein
LTTRHLGAGSLERFDAERLVPLIAAGLVALLAIPLFTVPWNHFDGGISASAATFTLHGLVPYRDYWLLYGPLTGWILAIPTAVLGPSVELIRIAGLAVLAAQSATVYKICRRWAPPFQAVLLAVVASLLVAVFVGLEMNAWPVAMTLALAGLAIRLESRRALLAGVLIGLAALARLDVGGYALLAALVLPDRRRMLIGFGASVAPVAFVLLLLVPISSLWEQLVWYPLVGPRQFRGVPSLDVLMPMSVAVPFTLVLAILPRIAIGASLVRGIARRQADVLAIAVFAGLCQLQTLGRSDLAHLGVAMPPAIALIAANLPGARRPALIGTAIVAPPLFAVAVFGLVIALSGPTPKDLALQRSIAVTRQAVDRDTPIFIALSRNRYTVGNALLAYYLTDRPPGSRWTLFNPGVTNTDATQTLMVADLEASGTNLMILDVSGAEWFETSNDSQIPGSTILDTYLDERFRTWCDFGDYRVAVRVAWDPASACPIANGP